MDIASQVQLPRYNSPLESLGRVMSMKQLMANGALQAEQLKGAQMQNEQARVEMDRDKAFRDAWANGDREGAFKADPVRYGTIQKQELEQFRANIEKDRLTNEAIYRHLSGAQDQGSYEQALMGMQQSGVDISKMPGIYTPGMRDGYLQKSLDIKGALEQKNKEIEQILAQNKFDYQQKNDAEQRAVTVRGQDLTATTTRRGQDMTQQTATADRTQRAKDAAASRAVTVRGQNMVDNRERQKLDASEGAIERAAQALAAGDLTQLSDIASLRGDQRLKIFDRAKQLNPNYNTAEVKRWIKNEEYFSPSGKGGQNLQSFDTFLQHANGAAEAVHQIRLTGSPAINKPLNWWRQNVMGDPNIVRLQAAIEPAKDEYMNFLLSGHAMHEMDKEKADRILNPDKYSPAQLEEGLKTIAHVAGARANAADFSYSRQSPGNRHLQNPLSPEGLASARRLGVRLNFDNGASVQQTGGTVKMLAPNGDMADVPVDQVSHYESMGAKRVSK